MQKIESNPEFIIFGGDAFPSQNIEPGDYKLSVYNITHLLTHYFPNKPVIYTLGNHDCYPAHNVRPNSNWLGNLADESLRDILTPS